MNEDNYIVKIEIPRFNEYIRIANARKAKPILKGSKKKLQKKYQNENYTWNQKGQLINAKTGLIVPANSLTVGSPRDWRINGQDVYNQKVKHSARNSIMVKMHAKFKDHLNQIKNIDPKLFPLTLRINFYIQDNNKLEGRDKNIDNDNRWIYHKVVQDTLVELKKMKDDNLYFINGNYHKTYFVENPEDCKLEIILLNDE